tara:strand:+ start:852 stop:1262 length:411 start_codon:yes stop_codon:yes gene_type:complete
MKNIELKKLTKIKLEELGRKFGLELDRRLSKGKLVKELDEHITSLDKNELEELGRDQGIELDKRKSTKSLVKEVASSGLTSEIPTSYEWIGRTMSSNGEIIKFSKDINYGNLLTFARRLREGGRLVDGGDYYTIEM